MEGWVGLCWPLGLVSGGGGAVLGGAGSIAGVDANQPIMHMGLDTGVYSLPFHILG